MANEKIKDLVERKRELLAEIREIDEQIAQLLGEKNEKILEAMRKMDEQIQKLLAGKDEELLNKMQEMDKQIEQLQARDNDAIKTAFIEKIEEQVTDIIKELGIPAHIKGYNYSRKAIMMVIADQRMLDEITTTLYPLLAHHYNSTPSAIERAIRHAIGVGFTKSKKSWKDILGLTSKPTNSEFIAMIADKFRKNK